MKGYVCPVGYYGYMPSEERWVLFDTESEYAEYFREHEER